MNIEERLREALRTEAAPADFVAKVLARAGGTPWWRRPAALTLAAVLAMAAILPSAIWENRRRVRGLEARAQLLTALAITRSRLVQVNQKIRKNTRHAL